MSNEADKRLDHLKMMSKDVARLMARLDLAERALSAAREVIDSHITFTTDNPNYGLTHDEYLDALEDLSDALGEKA